MLNVKTKKSGITRIVFVFKKFVIKIPNFRYQHDHFLQGCYSNWIERHYYKVWKKEKWEAKDVVVPTLFCSWFGLFQIQARARILKRDLTQAEEDYFSGITTDTKGNNFGYYRGRLVCVDYS